MNTDRDHATQDLLDLSVSRDYYEEIIVKAPQPSYGGLSRNFRPTIDDSRSGIAEWKDRFGPCKKPSVVNTSLSSKDSEFRDLSRQTLPLLSNKPTPTQTSINFLSKQNRQSINSKKQSKPIFMVRKVVRKKPVVVEQSAVHKSPGSVFQEFISDIRRLSAVNPDKRSAVPSRSQSTDLPQGARFIFNNQREIVKPLGNFLSTVTNLPSKLNHSLKGQRNVIFSLNFISKVQVNGPGKNNSTSEMLKPTLNTIEQIKNCTVLTSQAYKSRTAQVSLNHPMLRTQESPFRSISKSQLQWYLGLKITKAGD